ncbi:MAG: hypothetical protein ABW217_23955 [Polyangiaceae bacterium]
MTRQVVSPLAAPVLLLSAGSEVITLSLVEELARAGAPIALAAFGRTSLLARSPRLHAYREITWPDAPERAVRALSDWLGPIAERARAPLVAFATDDAVLRLLLEQRRELEPYVLVPRAHALAMSGLDKAELFEFLRAHGAAELSPPSCVLDSLADLPGAIERLGPELVLKPALKPYRVELALDRAGRKLLASWEYETSQAFQRALAASWDFSPRWLAQARMHAPPEGEAVVYVVRVPGGETRLVSAVARWKHPPVGGTGCVVETLPNPELEAAARRLAELIDLRGLAELEYLIDDSGSFKLLDVNARPWLQVALAGVAGLPVAALTWQALAGGALELPPDPTGRSRSWVMPERLLLSLVAGGPGSRFAAARRALGYVLRADYVPVHQSALGGVRRAWYGRMLRALLRRLNG